MHLNIRYIGFKRHSILTHDAIQPKESVKQVQRSQTSEGKQTQNGLIFHLFLFVFVLTAPACQEQSQSHPVPAPISEPSIEQYHLFLQRIDSLGIHTQTQLLAFIGEEDRQYHGFLDNMEDYDSLEISDLTWLTERICQNIYNQTSLGTLDSTRVIPIMKQRAERRLIQFFDQYNTKHNTK